MDKVRLEALEFLWMNSVCTVEEFEKNMLERGFTKKEIAEFIKNEGLNGRTK